MAEGYSDIPSDSPNRVVGQPFQKLETPALMVDLDIMEGNIDKMMAFLRQCGAGVGIRPHAKTHKTPQVAKAQMERGALGICCAKVGEAEAMAAGGLSDILIANQIVGDRKIARLVALSKTIDLKVAVDSERNLRDISRESQRQGGRVGIVVEVDVGMKRGGVRTIDDAVTLASLADTLPGVWYGGVMGYEGFAVFTHDFEARKAEADKAYDILLSFRDAIERRAGLDSGIVSAAGSGTYMFAAKRKGLTDIEAGSYVFMDVRYGSTPGVDFNHSLAVLSTISSHPEPDLYICDAGLKSMSKEFGMVSTLPSYGLQVTNMSEEHISLRPMPMRCECFASPAASTDSGASRRSVDPPGSAELPGLEVLDRKYGLPAGQRLDVGDKILLIPSHCCTTVNLHDFIYAVRDGRVQEVWRVNGRGRFT